MNLIGIGIEAETFPQARFVQIAKKISPKHAIVGLALADPSGVAKGLTEIKATDGEACIIKRLAQVADIHWRDHTAWDAAVAATVGVGSERGLSKKQEANGESYAEK